MPKETDRLKLPLPLGNESVTRESINGIFEKIDAGVATREDLDTLREAVSQMDIPDASLTQKGKVQLSNKTNGTSEALVATEKALGLVMTEALAAKELGVETKVNVVAALNSIGVSASTNDSWAQLITKMAGVIRATGNATSAQVLSGATFSNASANGLTGTMPNRGAGGVVTPGTSTRTLLAGYYNTAITVPGETNLVPENIRIGKSMYNVPGSLDPMTYTRLTSTIERVGQTPGTDDLFTDLIELPKDKTTLIYDYDGMILGMATPWADQTTMAGFIFRNPGVTNFNFIHQIVGYYVDYYSRTAEYKYSSWEIDMLNKRFRYVENGVPRAWTTITRVDFTKPIYLSSRFRIGSGTGSNAGRAYVTFQNSTVISY
ncbi:phage tail protein [Paenibacillus sp. MER 99-2]|uniref:phage tail protein n=1 Tax=Paenibacillus sp. MER 99-2 TaxID=2939572 RepID=UPI00203EB9E5|nr:phage tail protein [Paenibacillus sp. MER 99-2]MCM3174463.1 phage tail protein [Paenibacillus sp. MER 99-2]